MTKDCRQYSPYVSVLLITACLITLVACARFTGAPRTNEQSNGYDTYVNARFGYSICYPREVLVPQGEPENSDGRRFLSKDGNAAVWVFGSYNVLNQTLRDLEQGEIDFFKEQDDLFAVTQAQISGNAAVILGESGTRAYYAKLMISNGTTFTFAAWYPKADIPQYEPIISRMAGCFKELLHSTR